MFTSKARFALVGLALFAAACAEPDRTQIDNPLTDEQRALYFIETVDTTLSRDAKIFWESAHAGLTKDAGLDPDDPLAVARYADSAEGKAALRAKVEDGLRNVLAPRLMDALGTGTKPAFLAVQLEGLNIVPPGQQILVGVGLHGIVGAVQIYDGETGEKLSWAQVLAVGILAQPGIAGVAAEQQSGPAYTRLLAGFAPQVKGWVAATHPITLIGDRVKTPVPDLPGPKGF
ncbi:MAG: hypothetical protein AB8B85_18855 [Paracoccaceae bacterium]